MSNWLLRISCAAVAVAVSGCTAARTANVESPAGAERANVLDTPLAIDQGACSPERLGTSIPRGAIGEPVSAVTISAPRWVPGTATIPAHCAVDGAIAPIDPAAPAINFRVLLPAAWTYRAAQKGGGGMNGVIPNLVAAADFTTGATPLQRGFAMYGSDSGHQAAPAVSPEWTLNEEAIRNLGYMQMKKTRDAAMMLLRRMYGRDPAYNYYLGTSQGGREALTVAQRYPDDYDGVVANVPIVSFSTLMLAPELIRIQERQLASWVTLSKVNTIRDQFIRECDALDGLADGVINNYVACRANFDVGQGPAGRDPWRAKRCPDDIDPTPSDTTPSACLTGAQISTLSFVYSRYPFSSPLAHDNRTFGMWVPGTDPSGAGLILGNRFRGQEGASNDAPMHSHLGVLGVTGFLMRDLTSNPLDYVEGGPLDARRVQLSAWLDATDPDLSPFQRRGGRMIATIGTNDALASPGAQLDYYQSVIDRMGRSTVDSFARFYVIPQAGHNLSGTSYHTDGEGRPSAPRPIANSFDRLSQLMEWVEAGIAPGLSGVVTSADGSMPLCSYPTYPRYVGGDRALATSYTCAAP